MGKTLTIRALLYYLRRFLLKVPAARPRLLALHLKMNKAPLQKNTLWRHTTLKIEPTSATLLVYLTFLRREGAIEPNGKKSLFVYSFPELLRAKKPNPVSREGAKGAKVGI